MDTLGGAGSAATGFRAYARHFRAGSFTTSIGHARTCLESLHRFRGRGRRARALYERLIQLSGHVKVWIAYALFESEPIPLLRDEREDNEEDEERDMKTTPGDTVKARVIFRRAYDDLKGKKQTDERVALLEVWKKFEAQHGDPDDIAKVEGMKPIISKRRHEDHMDEQMVEEYVFVFPDDEKESNPMSFKFLQTAHAWKEVQEKTESEFSTSGDAG